VQVEILIRLGGDPTDSLCTVKKVLLVWSDKVPFAEMPMVIICNRNE
jgi:hypothetical protein